MFVALYLTHSQNFSCLVVYFPEFLPCLFEECFYLTKGTFQVIILLRFLRQMKVSTSFPVRLMYSYGYFIHLFYNYSWKFVICLLPKHSDTFWIWQFNIFCYFYSPPFYYHHGNLPNTEFRVLILLSTP